LLAHVVLPRQPKVVLARLHRGPDSPRPFPKEPAVILSRSTLSLALAAVTVTGVALVETASTASADVRIRIGGGGKIRFGHWHRHRPHVRYHGPTIRIGGSIWLGSGAYYRTYATPPPPPPPPSCDCAAPAYYPPIAPAPSTYVAAPAPVRDPLPRFGIGVYLGGVAVEGVNEGQDVGVVGQLRLSRSLVLEGEIAKNELADGDRVDRRMMAGLTFELSPRNRISPYVTGGIGVTQVDVGGGEFEDEQSLAEIGGGLRWRMSERITLFGDLRLGARQTIEDEDELRPQPTDPALGRVMPESDEDYSRLRLGALLTF
jgi:opacity protein-like surface antigen